MLEDLAKEFEKAHPNVTIDVSSGAPTTDDLLQKLSATFASDNYPDISYAYGSWAGQLGEVRQDPRPHRRRGRAGRRLGRVPGGRAGDRDTGRRR